MCNVLDYYFIVNGAKQAEPCFALNGLLFSDTVEVYTEVSFDSLDVGKNYMVKAGVTRPNGLGYGYYSDFFYVDKAETKTFKVRVPTNESGLYKLSGGVSIVPGPQEPFVCGGTSHSGCTNITVTNSITAGDMAAGTVLAAGVGLIYLNWGYIVNYLKIKS